ncbi:hypothetical protein H311_00981 [Anncaliia algerae PRA109]|nr:hypothetical protein H311_00981 [Anncaliia algerae PRA109]
MELELKKNLYLQNYQFRQQSIVHFFIIECKYWIFYYKAITNCNLVNLNLQAFITYLFCFIWNCFYILFLFMKASKYTKINNFYIGIIENIAENFFKLNIYAIQLTSS